MAQFKVKDRIVFEDFYGTKQIGRVIAVQEGKGTMSVRTPRTTIKVDSSKVSLFVLPKK